MKEAIEALIKNRGGSPFLFVGSGFSRRYLGLEDWGALLRRFSDGIGDFDYYLASADGSYPKAASLLAEAFHDVWWKDERFENSRQIFKDGTKTREDALKNEISLYLSNVDLNLAEGHEFGNEIESLRRVNVDGVITTNWDRLLEDIFPEYKVYVGQEELLFSNPQSIGEIYKIHGSCEKPQSLVLTEKDYEDFESKNPYLAAKLITIFIEHPIIFIGYSISDPHITNIIFSIASCLGEERIDRFAENLIFLTRASGGLDKIKDFTFSRDGKNIPAKIIETDDFSQVFDVIAENKRKIPARILRYCKEQMFELVKSSEPQEKMYVLDIDDLDQKEDVEFVVGVGVASSAANNAENTPPEGYADSGYQGLDRDALLRDIVREKSEFEAAKILEFVIPKVRKTGATYIPIFRYLREAGIESESALRESGFEATVAAYDRLKGKSYRYGSTYGPAYHKNWSEKSAEEIIEGAGLDKGVIFLAYKDRSEIDIEWLRSFLEDNLDRDFVDPYATAFNKLICLYDKWVYGFESAQNSEVVAEVMEG